MAIYMAIYLWPYMTIYGNCTYGHVLPYIAIYGHDCGHRFQGPPPMVWSGSWRPWPASILFDSPVFPSFLPARPYTMH